MSSDASTSDHLAADVVLPYGMQQSKFSTVWKIVYDEYFNVVPNSYATDFQVDPGSNLQDATGLLFFNNASDTLEVSLSCWDAKNAAWDEESLYFVGEFMREELHKEEFVELALKYLAYVLERKLKSTIQGESK